MSEPWARSIGIMRAMPRPMGDMNHSISKRRSASRSSRTEVMRGGSRVLWIERSAASTRAARVGQRR